MNDAPLRAPWLEAIARAFSGSPVYAVGGAVRNTLMGLPVSDVDLCGAARPGEVQELCEGTEITARLRAAHFGTVELIIGGHMAEYTTFRSDSYRGGHQPFAVRFAASVEEDAFRRDFSVNALYAPLDDPATVIDATGGLQHLKERILHTVTADPDQVLKDDGLRILRAARFQAELGFTPTGAVLASAKKHARLLDEIAAERKRDELTKLLLSDTKYPSLCRTAPPVSAGLATLVRVGAWEKLFGSLAPMDFTALDRAQTLGAGGKLALLYHREPPERLTETMAALRFAKRGIQAAADALAILYALRNPKTEPSDTLRFGLPALQTAAAMLAALSDEPETLRRAEGILASALEKSIPAGVAALAVGGHELLMLCAETGAPKEHIGKALDALWRDAVNGRVPNTRDALLTRARKHLIDSQNGG